MYQDQGTGTYKCITFILNIIVFISGISITFVGAEGLKDDAFKEDRDMRAILITMTVLGSLIIVFSLVGSCALLSENTTLLNLYSFICFVSTILILVTAIIAFVFKNKITDKQFNMMEKRFKTFEVSMAHNNLKKKDEDAIDFVQSSLNCCGWTKSFPESSRYYPSSCTCAGSKDNCKLFKRSKTCSKLYKNYVTNTILSTAWLCTIVLIFPIICAVTSSKMVSKIKGFTIIRDLS